MAYSHILPKTLFNPIYSFLTSHNLDLALVHIYIYTLYIPTTLNSRPYLPALIHRCVGRSQWAPGFRRSLRRNPASQRRSPRKRRQGFKGLRFRDLGFFGIYLGFHLWYLGPKTWVLGPLGKALSRAAYDSGTNEGILVDIGCYIVACKKPLGSS